MKGENYNSYVIIYEIFECGTVVEQISLLPHSFSIAS